VVTVTNFKWRHNSAQITTGIPPNLTGIFGFPRSLQKNPGIVPSYRTDHHLQIPVVITSQHISTFIHTESLVLQFLGNRHHKICAAAWKVEFQGKKPGSRVSANPVITALKTCSCSPCQQTEDTKHWPFTTVESEWQKMQLGMESIGHISCDSSMKAGSSCHVVGIIPVSLCFNGWYSAFFYNFKDDAVWFSRWKENISLPWRWRQRVSPQHWYTCIGHLLVSEWCNCQAKRQCHSYSSINSGLVGETKQILCPCHLMYKADSSTSSVRCFTGQKLTTYPTTNYTMPGDSVELIKLYSAFCMKQDQHPIQKFIRSIISQVFKMKIHWLMSKHSKAEGQTFLTVYYMHTWQKTWIWWTRLYIGRTDNKQTI